MSEVKKRTLPAVEEVEEQVIGAILFDGGSFNLVSGFLKSEHFFNSRNQTIYEAFLELDKERIPIDTISLTENLKKSGKMQAAGNITYISKLISSITTSAQLEYHSRLIFEKYLLRKLISTGSLMVEKAFNETGDVFELLDNVEKEVLEIAKKKYDEASKPFSDNLREAIELIEAIHSKKETNFSLKTKFTGIDDLLGGFHKSDFIIIAARPGMGKTAFALSVAKNLSVYSDSASAIFSLEMPTIQLVFRLISAESKINVSKLRTGKFSAEEGKKIGMKASKLSKAKIFIDDTPNLSILELKAKARRLKHEKDISIIFIDYLQLMSDPTIKEGREREISNISRSLKGLAKELNIPIVALSQLNRVVESTSDKRPMLQHLRESGAIEQDADVVMFLYRPEFYGITNFKDDNTSTEGIAEVIVAKHRNGATGEVRLIFEKEFTNFENLAFDYGNLPEAQRNYNKEDII